MKVIIATSTAPYVLGGPSLLVDWLEEALRSRGHEVEIYRIPIDDNPTELPSQMVGLRMSNFTGHGDRLIAVRTPSYLVKHHSKVVWFLHHNRPAYDLWSTFPTVPNNPLRSRFRRMMFTADDVALSECQQIFTNSARMSQRLKRYNGLDSKVLYPPLGERITYDSKPLGDTIVYVSRVVTHKRQHLAVEALARTRTPVKLILAGRGEDGSDYAEKIYQQIARLDLIGRVNFVNTVVSEESKRQLISHSLGRLYSLGRGFLWFRRIGGRRRP